MQPPVLSEASFSSAAVSVIRQLASQGWKAWIVGGAVRDACMGRRPQDEDICTDALPGEVLAVFEPKAWLTGGAHGTVTVKAGGRTIEVTTLRQEGRYGDRRHPDVVSFTTDLQLDLARRDFTVNAMAWSPEDGLVDPWNGLSDLEHLILRTVRDPDERLSEDALRVLRGLRFMSTYGLRPEPAAEAALRRHAADLRWLAPERILVEWRLALTGAYFPEVCAAYPEINCEVWPHLPLEDDVVTYLRRAGWPIEPEALRLAWFFRAGFDLVELPEAEGTVNLGQLRRRLPDQGSNPALMTAGLPHRLRDDALAVETAWATLYWLTDWYRRRFHELESQFGQQTAGPESYIPTAVGSGIWGRPRWELLKSYASMMGAPELIFDPEDVSGEALAVNGDDLLAVRRDLKQGKALGRLLGRIDEARRFGLLPNERDVLLDCAAKL